MSNNSVVVIVDGCGAGRFFVQQFNKRGYKCIHIQSLERPTNKNYVLSNPNDYVDSFVYDNNLETLINKIELKFHVLNVLPGNELGVELSHQLAQKLNLTRNEDSSILSRRNKYNMVEALKYHGLNSVEHHKSSDFNEARRWILEILEHSTWPIVAKPLDSAGSDHVYICKDIIQIENAFNNILNGRTTFDKNCSEVLFQTYLAGDEYVVNMVSCNGHHLVTEIRVYHKQDINGKHLYDYEELLSFDGNVQEQLIDYAKKVADAVGIKNGPSHTEIILTNHGPILVEIAARISGATHVDISNQTLGYNVIDLTIDSYFDPEKFMTYLSTNPEIKKYENIIDIATDKQGLIKQLPSQQFLSSLPSVKNIRWNIQIGDYLKPTESLINSPAKIHMVHENRSQLEIDREIIKDVFLKELQCESITNVMV